MQLAKIGARGRTTIPKAVRVAADLRAGDVIGFEIEGDRLLVHRVAPGQDKYLHGVATTMSEWQSPEDEEAWCEL